MRDTVDILLRNAGVPETHGHTQAAVEILDKVRGTGDLSEELDKRLRSTTEDFSKNYFGKANE